MYVCMYVWLYVCVYVFGDQRTILGIFLRSHSLWLLRKGLSLVWRLPIRLDLLLIKLQGSAHLLLPRAGIASMHHDVQFFYMGSGHWLWVLRSLWWLPGRWGKRLEKSSGTYPTATPHLLNVCVLCPQGQCLCLKKTLQGYFGIKCFSCLCISLWLLLTHS